jgi:hypothetical protein
LWGRSGINKARDSGEGIGKKEKKVFSFKNREIKMGFWREEFYAADLKVQNLVLSPKM